MRLGQEGAPPPGRWQVARIRAVLPGDDEDSSAHGALVNHEGVSSCNRRRRGASNSGCSSSRSRRRMWIVRLALRRPYTIAVLCSLIAIFGLLSTTRMKTDILPAIDIPVVIVVWNYPGLSADDMERRGVFINERALSTTGGGISRIDPPSLKNIRILKGYFEPGSDIGGASPPGV